MKKLVCFSVLLEEIQAIAQKLENEILLAYVYRNSHFLKKYSFSARLDLMETAYEIFTKNGMADQAIYSRNNKNVRQFDTDSIRPLPFLELQEEAINNVPGMVGMSHILNNAGAALLTNGQPDEAIYYFERALDYAHRPERVIQNLAIRSNIAISKVYAYSKIDENEVLSALRTIFDNPDSINLPFLTGRYALNLVAAAFYHNSDFGNYVLSEFPIGSHIQKSLDNHPLGSGQMLLQIEVLEKKYGELKGIHNCRKGIHFEAPIGIRKKFIENNGTNPCSFSTWF